MSRFFVLVLLVFVAQQPTAEVLKFKCNFERMSNPFEVKEYSQPFTMEFLMDTGTDKSYIVGNQGISEVELVYARHAFVFIEYTPSQNIMTTSILHDTESPEMVGWSVHSRHTFFTDADGASPQPSQSYGRCLPE